MKTRQHKTKIGKYCSHLARWFVVNFMCIDSIVCHICRDELKDKYNNDNENKRI
jgi:hypothetical protein